MDDHRDMVALLYIMRLLFIFYLIFAYTSPGKGTVFAFLRDYFKIVIDILLFLVIMFPRIFLEVADAGINPAEELTRWSWKNMAEFLSIYVFTSVLLLPLAFIIWDCFIRVR